MTLDKIIAVTGKPGLYELISGGKKNIIIESLADGKRFPISAMNNISTLESIAIYTETKEVPLTEVFYTIFKKEAGKETISHKESAAKLTAYFTEILPDYDTERVYVSNLKKIFQWFNILLAAKFDFETLAPKENDDGSGEE